MNASQTDSDTATQRTTFRVAGVPEHFNLPWHLACESDAFANHGLDVRFNEYGGGTGQMSAALEAGEVELAVLLLEGGLRESMNGAPFKLVKLYTDTPLIWGVHVSAHSDIASIEQARGKRYAISRFGSGSHLIAIVDAAERGWPTDNINFVKIGNLEGARESLASDGSDIFLWEKFMTKPLVDSGEFRRIDDRIVPWPAFAVAVRDDVLKNHSEQVKRILEIVSKSSADLHADPAAAGVIAQRYPLQMEDAKEWLSKTRWNTDFECPAEALDKVAGYLKMLGLLENPEQGWRDAWVNLKY